MARPEEPLSADAGTIEQAMHLVSDNKVSTRNAFDVHLIEHMDSILEEFADAEDFHRAAGVLNASARVYGFRVDSVYVDANKFSTSWIDPDKEDSEEEKQKEQKQFGLPQGKDDNLKPVSLVTMSQSELLQTMDALDPFYSHMARQIENGGDSALLLNLLPHGPTGRTIFDGATGIHEQCTPWKEEFAASPASLGVEVPRLTGALCPDLPSLVAQALDAAAAATKHAEKGHPGAEGPREGEEEPEEETLADFLARTAEPLPAEEAAKLAEYEAGGLAALAPEPLPDASPEMPEQSLAAFLDDLAEDGDPFAYAKLPEAGGDAEDGEDGEVQNAKRATAAKNLLAAERRKAAKLRRERLGFFAGPSTRTPQFGFDADAGKLVRLSFFEKEAGEAPGPSTASQILAAAAAEESDSESDFEGALLADLEATQKKKTKRQLEREAEQEELAAAIAADQDWEAQEEETQREMETQHAALFSGYQNAKASTLRVPHVVDRMEKAVVANAKKGGAQVQFTDLLRHVRKDLTEEEGTQLTPAIGFLCILHLAADKGCEIVPGANMGDFKVVPGRIMEQQKAALPPTTARKPPPFLGAAIVDSPLPGKKGQDPDLVTPAKRLDFFANSPARRTEEKVPAPAVARSASPPTKAAKDAAGHARPAARAPPASTPVARKKRP